MNKTCKDCKYFPCMISMPCDLALHKLCKRYEMKRKLVTDYIFPSEVIGDIFLVDSKTVRAMVAVTHSGPLLLMEFKLKENEE